MKENSLFLGYIGFSWQTLGEEEFLWKYDLLGSPNFMQKIKKKLWTIHNCVSSVSNGFKRTRGEDHICSIQVT